MHVYVYVACTSHICKIFYKDYDLFMYDPKISVYIIIYQTMAIGVQPKVLHDS